MSKKYLPFRKLDLKSKLGAIMGIAIILFAALAIFALLIFFGVAGFFKLFGVSYESHTSILLFIVLCFIIGGVFEFIGKILIAMAALTVEDKTTYRSLKFMIDFAMNLVTFHIVDQFMDSVFIPSNVLFIAAALIAVIEVVFDEKKSFS
ncbi:YrvL family regulatory protein [Bacillus swezeyi]|uniref:YrvL family regulatory protein n=1 Tax=Bacillus swezeyi TaxID=1925020 RepID=UPI002E1EE354|nr:YrvL family regulatory protein [Bacillus swezeyi]MED2979425.1 YrvL family regulatory protein [Bacillus swezeyi]